MQTTTNVLILIITVIPRPGKLFKLLGSEIGSTSDFFSSETDRTDSVCGNRDGKNEFPS
jgi:hypothetical protein